MGDVPTELLVAIATSSIAAFASIVVAVINLRSNKDLKSYRKMREEREAIKSDLDVGVARILLLNNYREACSKGYYSVEERDVYHELFVAYKAAGGDGVIDDIAEKIVLLPTYPKQDQHPNASVIDQRLPKV